MKFKPVYSVYINEEVIGEVEDKKKFEKKIEEALYDNEKENIAFSDINENLKYKLKLVNRNSNIEGNVLNIVKEKADKTYFKYAISIEGTEKAYVKTLEEAKEIEKNLIAKLDETNITVTKTYAKSLDINNEDTLTLTENLINETNKEKQEKEKRKKSTINGIYIAVKPISGIITSRYGARESVRNHTHQGLDIAATTGTPIKAVADGTVTFSGTKGGYGNIVIINHGNGIETYYAHCSKLDVEEGAKVIAGDVIGKVGSTGNSTGPHLHFEIRKDGKYINPENYL